MEIELEINGCNMNCRDLFSSWFLKYTSLLHDFHMFRALLCECFTVIAKQRIDSGFFLFQAEQKKKAEKKKNKKMLKTKNCTESSDDDFMWSIRFFIAYKNSSNSCGIKILYSKCIPKCIKSETSIWRDFDTTRTGREHSY